MLGEIDHNLIATTPQIFLTKPNRTTIAKLKEAYGFRKSVKLGAVDEISFTLPVNVEIDHIVCRNPNLEKIKDRYLLRVVENDSVQWYTIRNSEALSEDEGDFYKFTAYSLEHELTDKLIRGLKRVSVNLRQIMADALKEVLAWKLGYVNADFDLRFREFNVSSKTVLDFIYEIAQTFDAIVDFDTVRREINFYKPEQIGIDRGLRFSVNKYIKTANRQLKSDDFATRLIVEGKDGLSIQDQNPTGANYLDDFSYFLYPFQRDTNRHVLSHSDYMTDDMCHKILDYQELVESKKGLFGTYLTQKQGLQTQRSQKEIELQDLINQRDQAHDNDQSQKALETTIYYNFKYNGSPITKNTTLPRSSVDGVSTAYKYAIMYKVSTTTGVTMTLDGVVKSITPNKWEVLDKVGAVENPIVPPTLTKRSATTGLSKGTYFVKYSWYDGVHETGVSPESYIAIEDREEIIVQTPSFPAGVTKARIYIGLSSGEQKLQGESSTRTYVQSNILTGTIPPSNTDSFLKSDIRLSGSATNVDVELLYVRITDDEFIETNNDREIIARYNLSNAETLIALKNGEIQEIDNQISAIDVDIADLQEVLRFERYFTEEELLEINEHYIVAKEFIDQRYTNSKSLYDAAVEHFQTVKIPQTIVDIDIVDFMQVVECRRDWNKLNLGDIVTAKHENIGVNVKAKIVEYVHDYEEPSLKLTIANVKDIETDEQKLIRILYKSHSTSTTVDRDRTKWDGIEETRGAFQDFIDSKFDAVKQTIEAGSSKNLEISDRGLISRHPTDRNTYLLIQNSVLATTPDNGNTWEAAITRDGVVARRLVGQIITGNKLTLGDEDGILQILGNKGVISDRNGQEVMKFGLYHFDPTTDTEKFGLFLQNAKSNVIVDKDDGFRIQKKIGFNKYDDVAWLNTDGLLNIKGLKIDNLDGQLTNGISIDPINGLVITRTDGMVKTTLNATDGFKIERNIGSGRWDKVFYVDTFGDASLKGHLDVLSLSINGVEALTADTETLNANVIKIKSTLLEDAYFMLDGEGIRAFNGVKDTFKIDIEGNAWFGGNITSDAIITGATIRSGGIGTDRIELSGNTFRGVTSLEKDAGLKFSITSGGLTDIGLYHNGKKLVEFYDGIQYYSIRPTSDASALFIGDTFNEKPTNCEGEWNFYSEINLKVPFVSQPKMRIYTNGTGENAYPVIELGVGTGVGSRGKGFIDKDVNSLSIRYITSDGRESYIKFLDNGDISIRAANNINITGSRINLN